jgi:SAM-dependent methyltransferase
LIKVLFCSSIRIRLQLTRGFPETQFSVDDLWIEEVEKEEEGRIMTASRYGYESQAFVAELYDVVNARRNPKDLNFFINYARQAQGKVLELGCGTGRVLIPTAVAGCAITGLDISSHMLGKCREKLAVQPPEVRERVNLVQANMADFNTAELYPLVTIPFRPFQHLITVPEQKSCLKCVNQHLLPRGWLVLDLANCYPPAMYDPRYWAEQEIQRDLPLADGSRLRFATRIADFHRHLQYNDFELVYYVTQPDGSTERFVQAYPWRYFFRYEVEHLLELCGFRVVDLFGDHDGSAYSNDSPEMIFVAEKI